MQSVFYADGDVLSCVFNDADNWIFIVIVLNAVMLSVVMQRGLFGAYP